MNEASLSLPHGYICERNMTDAFLKQLIERTNADEEVQKFTSDMCRFNTEEAYKSWNSRRRSIFILTNAHGVLCGFGWCSQKNIPNHLQPRSNASLTLAIRIYPPFRGKGLSIPFFMYMIRTLEREKPFGKEHERGYWIRRRLNNEVAEKVYKACGFTELTRDAEGVYLVRSV
ncbi:MAG TPA: hypothetical protein VJ246_03955 [Patescibacteria group bacterium]|nr:hypothetical protein [Patescibacteria group bacterium]